jgi:hypothetical protein
LTAISIVGKISGGIALAGWRRVRVMERRATAPTCSVSVTLSV